MFSPKNLFRSIAIMASILCLAPIASAQTYNAIPQQQGLPYSSLLQEHDAPGELPAMYLRLACVNCQKGEQTKAAQYIEQSLKELARRSQETGTQTKFALRDAVGELNDRARQLRVGQKVTAKQIESAFAKAAQALGDGTLRVTDNIGHRSTRIYDATTGFGHSILRDAKNDAKYLSGRTQLFGGRVTLLTAESAFAAAGH